MYKMKTWKQEFLVMVYISITTAFRSRGKGHLAYYMRILHDASLGSISQLPPEGGGLGFITTLTMHRGLSINAQTNQLECHRQVA